MILTASAAGDIAEANIEIRSGMSLPTGSMKWSVTELPGCKTTKIIPAIDVMGAALGIVISEIDSEHPSRQAPAR